MIKNVWHYYDKADAHDALLSEFSSSSNIIGLLREDVSAAQGHEEGSVFITRYITGDDYILEDDGVPFTEGEEVEMLVRRARK